MEIKSVRTLEEMREVLKTYNAPGPKNVYWVFSDLGHKVWENMTIITPGLYGGEYPKTYGHYHTTTDAKETYHLVNGQGVFLLQKKHVENGKIIIDVVDEVLLIGCQPGDEVTISKEYGHSWSNTGLTPLITFDNWTSGHSPDDYDPMKTQQGMAYYLTDNNGELKLVPNPKYKNLPEPKWMTAAEFLKHSA
jgi:oxalate decarboxylase/phosphoglucose isomerase-like protein (cupin superfamily)